MNCSLIQIQLNPAVCKKADACVAAQAIVTRVYGDESHPEDQTIGVEFMRIAGDTQAAINRFLERQRKATAVEA